MIVVAAASLAVAVVLAAALLRTRRRVSEQDASLNALSEQRNAAQLDAATAHDRAASARRERDDALQRVQRARRDASEVAARLSEESAARAEAEAAVAQAASRGEELARQVAEATAAVADCTTELEELRSQQVAPVSVSSVEAGPSSAAGDLAVLWELALVRAERTWRTSISLSVDAESPLASSDDPLRTAVEIEIDAAREEAGADIDLRWSGEAAVPAAAAVVVFSLVESAIAEVSKSEGRTTVHVTVGEDQVELRFEAVDDTGEPVPLRLPDTVSTSPGQARVPLVPSP